MNRRNLSPNVAERRRTTSARPLTTINTFGVISTLQQQPQQQQQLQQQPARSNVIQKAPSATNSAVNPPIQRGTFVPQPRPLLNNNSNITGNRPSDSLPKVMQSQNADLHPQSNPSSSRTPEQVSAMSPKKPSTSTSITFDSAITSQASPTKLAPTSHEGPPPKVARSASAPVHAPAPRSASPMTADVAFGQIETDGTRQRKDLKSIRETGLTGIYLTDYIVDTGVPLEHGRMSPPTSGEVSVDSAQTSHTNSPVNISRFGIRVQLDQRELEDAVEVSSKDGGYCKFFGRGREVVYGPQGSTDNHKDFMIKGVSNILPTGEVTGKFIECDALSEARIPSAHTRTTDSCTYRCVRGMVVGYYDQSSQDQRVPQSTLSLLKVPMPGRVVLWRPRGQKHCIPLDLTRCRPIQCLRCQHCQGIVPLDETRYHMIDYHGATGQSPKQYATA